MDTRSYPRVPQVIDARATTSASLLSQVLIISSIGFLVSALGVYFAPAVFSPAMFWFCVIASFGLIFAVRATRNSPVVAFGMFLLLTLVMGFEISPWIQMLLHTGHQAAVFNAALTTAGGMACIGIGAQFARFDYRRVGNLALAALFALIIASIVMALFHYVQPTIFSWLTLVIFSVLLIVDFMRIRAGGDGRTAVELAVSIYLDGLNIFLALTQIFSGGRRRN